MRCETQHCSVQRMPLDTIISHLCTLYYPTHSLPPANCPCSSAPLLLLHLQTSTATGRLAMEEPNLQNMPKPITFQLDSKQPGEGTGQAITCNIRSAFVAPPGWVMLGADYCQLELRLMAHFSGDEALRDMLRGQGPGSDPFRALAARWLGADPENVRVTAGWWLLMPLPSQQAACALPSAVLLCSSPAVPWACGVAAAGRPPSSAAADASCTRPQPPPIHLLHPNGACLPSACCPTPAGDQRAAWPRQAAGLRPAVRHGPGCPGSGPWHRHHDGCCAR